MVLAAKQNSSNYNTITTRKIDYKKGNNDRQMILHIQILQYTHIDSSDDDEGLENDK